MAEFLVIEPDETIAAFFQRRVDDHPDRMALLAGDSRLTFAELRDRAGKLAMHFHQLGIQLGEKVALILPSCEPFVTAFFAATWVGAVVVSVNPQLKAAEMKHILNDSEAVLAVVAEDTWGGTPFATLQAIRNELPGLRHIVAARRVSGPDGSLALDLELPDSRLPVAKQDVREVAALIYTSGTTGAPKGSIHTHRTILFPVRMGQLGTKELLEKPLEILKTLIKAVIRYDFRFLKWFGKPTTSITPIPMYTTSGLVTMLGGLLGGNPLIIMERFIPGEMVNLIEKEKVNAIIAVPSMVTMLLRTPELEKANTKDLLYVIMGAAPVPPTLVREIRKRTGAMAVIGFGATELGGSVTGTNPVLDSDKNLEESVGKLAAGWEAKVVDEHRNQLPNGTVGELAIRGEGVMKGYHKADDLTSETIDADGYYYTGDLAIIDKDGYIKIVGRKKDMIIRGGQNLYPAEIEAVIVAHPKIRQAAVVGVPDELAGERAVAFVVLEEGAVMTAADVLDFCRKEMAPYKVPSNVMFVTELPTNPSGKILKTTLRDMVKK